MKHMHVPCILPLIKLKIVARLPYTLDCIALSHQHDLVFAIPGACLTSDIESMSIWSFFYLP